MKFYDGKRLVDLITKDENNEDWSFDIWDGWTAEYNEELDAYLSDNIDEDIKWANDWAAGTGEFASSDYDEWGFGKNREVIVEELEIPQANTLRIKYKRYNALMSVIDMMFEHDKVFVVDRSGLGCHKTHLAIDTNCLSKANAEEVEKHIEALRMAIEITNIVNSLNIEYYRDGDDSATDMEFVKVCAHVATALARRDTDMLKRVLETGRV